MNGKFLSLGLTVAVAAASSLFAQPQTGSLTFGVSVTGTGGALATDNETTSWTATPAGLSLGAMASSPDGAGNPNSAYENGSATWAADGSSGTVSLGIGWNLTDADGANTNLSSADWSYTFTAEESGSFNLSYNVTASGYTFGLWGWSLADDLDSGSGAPVTNAFDPTTSGLFVGGITDGNTYTVSLSNNGNIYSDGGGVSAVGSASGTFDWSITPSAVPDGGMTLAMVGMGLTGLTMLRRRFAR
jgi:hypothetical protein